MKRVGFCGLKQFDASCKMPLCLRFGTDESGNGDGSTCDKCKDHRDSSNVQRYSGENLRKDNCECHRTKGNFFNAIRRKWRRNKRGKRCDTRKRGDAVINGCHTYDRSEDVHVKCVKHQRLKSEKSASKTSTNTASCICESKSVNVSSDCKNHVGPTEVIVCGTEEEEECSCFGSPSRRTFSNVTAKVVKLKARASKSLSDIASAANVSSPTSKTDSDSDICRITTMVDPTSPGNTMSYANGLYVDSTENVDASFIQEASPCGFLPGQKFGNLTQELYKLSKYGWYWGPINRSEADSKLIDQPDGAFLVRDSSDDRYILSLSFRSYGKTLHTRIEHSNGLFSFYSQPEPEGHASIVELIKQSMRYSQSGVFCYSRSRSPGSPSFPVRLTKPISRFTQVRSLQYLCRFVIRQYTRYDHIQKLPLPERIKGYLEEGHY